MQGLPEDDSAKAKKQKSKSAATDEELDGALSRAVTPSARLLIGGVRCLFNTADLHVSTHQIKHALDRPSDEHGGGFSEKNRWEAGQVHCISGKAICTLHSRLLHGSMAAVLCFQFES